MLEAIQQFDQSVLLFLQDSVRGGILTPLMIFFTYLGEVGAIWILLGIAMLISKKYRGMGFTLLFVIAVSWVINDLVIKELVCRARPFNTVDGLTALVHHPSSYSFPSGHTCSSFAGAYAMTRMLGKKGAWFYVLAALIAFSRMYVGVHYPTDVLAGIIVGTLGGMLAYWIRHKWIKLWRD